MSIEAIIFYLILIDAVSANLIIIFGKRWYMEHLRVFSRWFPPAEGWAIYYLILVIWIGSLLSRAGMI